MQQDVYTVKVTIQWLLDGYTQDFVVKTLAESMMGAEVKVREQFRHAYYVQVKEIK